VEILEGLTVREDLVIQSGRQIAWAFREISPLLAAQGYQESGLDQSKRSSAGAIGIMQLLPSTAADWNVAISDIQSRSVFFCGLQCRSGACPEFTRESGRSRS